MQNQNWLYFILGALLIGFILMFIYNYGLLARALGNSDSTRQVEKAIALKENYPNFYYYPYSYFYYPWWRSNYYWPFYGYSDSYDYPYYYGWSTSYSYPSSTIYRTGRRGRRFRGKRFSRRRGSARRRSPGRRSPGRGGRGSPGRRGVKGKR